MIEDPRTDSFVHGTRPQVWVFDIVLRRVDAGDTGQPDKLSELHACSASMARELTIKLREREGAALRRGKLPEDSRSVHTRHRQDERGTGDVLPTQLLRTMFASCAPALCELCGNVIHACTDHGAGTRTVDTKPR